MRSISRVWGLNGKGTNDPAEQAVLLWPMLALAARTQQILSYAAVEGYTGIARHELKSALGLVHDHCQRRGWPL